MAHCIEGIDPAPFAPLFGLSDEALAARRARRVTADARPGFPCRVSLEDAEPGETLLLVHHVAHDVETPFRSAYAIYVREGEPEAAEYADAPPPVFASRTLGLRGFDSAGTLRGALLAAPGEADARIRELLDRPRSPRSMRTMRRPAASSPARQTVKWPERRRAPSPRPSDFVRWCSAVLPDNPRTSPSPSNCRRPAVPG